MIRDRSRLKIGFAMILSGVAGFVDTLGFMSLAHVYAANMTGNTVSVAIGWAKHDWGLCFRRGMPLPSFFLGLVGSRLIIRSARRRGIDWAASLPLALEALFLVVLIALGQPRLLSGEIRDASELVYFAMVFLISAAMGLQNAILSHFGPLSVRTTHVTGTLAKCADELVSGHLDKASLYGAAWLSYLIGAIPGAFLLGSIGYRALWIPVSILAILAAVNFARPILRWTRGHPTKAPCR